MLLESDFQEHYGVDLEAVFRVKSWRWFRVRVFGLMSADTRLHRHFTVRTDNTPPLEELQHGGEHQRWEH